MQVCAKPTASSGHGSENQQNRWIGTIWIWCVCTRKVARLKYTLSQTQYIAAIWIYTTNILKLSIRHDILRSTIIYVYIGNTLCMICYHTCYHILSVCHCVSVHRAVSCNALDTPRHNPSGSFWPCPRPLAAAFAAASSAHLTGKTRKAYTQTVIVIIM